MTPTDTNTATDTTSSPSAENTANATSLGALIIASVVSVLLAIVFGIPTILVLTTWVVIFYSAWAGCLVFIKEKKEFLYACLRLLTLCAVGISILGVAIMVKASLDMATAGMPGNPAGEYPICYPSVAEVSSSSTSGVMMLGIGIAIGLPNLIHFAPSAIHWFFRPEA